jgi:tRNA U54 and U55 pseudouridine synthase Pus10
MRIGDEECVHGTGRSFDASGKVPVEIEQPDEGRPIVLGKKIPQLRVEALKSLAIHSVER